MSIIILVIIRSSNGKLNGNNDDDDDDDDDKNQSHSNKVKDDNGDHDAIPIPQGHLTFVRQHHETRTQDIGMYLKLLSGESIRTIILRMYQKLRHHMWVGNR